jgi:orotidine-5'-phosphate decarboxylase
VNQFSDRLIRATREVGSPTCVGLDPVLERLPPAVRAGVRPAAAIGAFSRGVIDAVAGLVAAIKPQSACFERYGAEGVDELARTCGHARERGLLVVLDAKRGDIGITAEHYAAAAAGLGADALTVNPYLGPETLRPYLAAGLGIFALVRTSNPDSDRVQSAALAEGGTVAALVASRVAELGEGSIGEAGYSDVGAVVGATKAADGRALRGRMPRQVFLVPGYGAQGGTAEDLRALHDGRSETGGGLLVTASRSVIYSAGGGEGGGGAAEGGEWRRAVARAALAFSTEVRGVVG